MRVTLTVLAGPNVGHVIAFDGHDSFVVGRSKRTSAQLPEKDPYLSRYHFLIETNPPLCRVVDLQSRNKTFVNNEPADAADLHDGDLLKAGHTVFRVGVDGTVPPDPERTAVRPPSSGELTIPGYQLHRELGRGAMGVVYAAVREADGRAVAVKTIQPAIQPDEKTVQRFLREAAILGQIDHPNVVRHLDGGEAGGVLWFAMEYVPGVDGRKWVRDRGPMPVPLATAVAADLVRALASAHAKGFVHRDVKPANVLLEPVPGGGLRVRLADFGLARAYDASRMSGLTLTGEPAGTPAFMAPEQIIDFRNVGPAADMYSTAATLYYLLTGKFPFDPPATVVELYRMILEDEPVPVYARRPDVPAELADAIGRGLNKHPRDRCWPVAPSA